SECDFECWIWIDVRASSAVSGGSLMSRFTNIVRAAAVAGLVLGGVAAVSSPAFAKNPMVGGAAMYPTKNIVENAVNSKDHTTLVAAVKAAGLVKTLEGKGPFTVF